MADSFCGDTSVLKQGQQLNQKQFHQLYCRTPETYRAELLGGVVYEPPCSVSYEHDSHNSRIFSLLDHYALGTPGVQAGLHPTTILSDYDEVQPDAFLRILPTHGGRSKNIRLKEPGGRRQYISGPPELMCEVACSRKRIDLGIKKERYTFAGVKEYAVICDDPLELHWFDLQNHSRIEPQKKIIRSHVFPGLWVDVEALLTLDANRSLKVLRKGLKSPEHAEFVRELEAAK